MPRKETKTSGKSPRAGRAAPSAAKKSRTSKSSPRRRGKTKPAVPEPTLFNQVPVTPRASLPVEVKPTASSDVVEAPEVVQVAEPLASPLSRPLPAGLPTAAAAVLVGLAAGGQFRGVQTLFAATIDPLPATAAMVTIVALLAVVAGMQVAKRAIGFIQRIYDRSLTARSKLAPDASNLPPWLLTALISAAGGFLTLACVAASGPVLRLYHRLLDQFFWTNLTLAGLEWFMVATLLTGPCVVLGILVAAIEMTGDSSDSFPHRPLLLPAGLLTGVFLALLARAVLPWPMSAEQQIVLGTLPLFVLAAGGVLVSHRPDGRNEPIESSEANSIAPTQPEGTLVQLAPFLWALSVTVVCAGWMSCRASPVAAGRHAAEVAQAALFGSIALVALASAGMIRVGRARPDGTAVWLGGVGAGLAASLEVWLPRSFLPVFAQVAVLSIPFGYGLYAVSHRWCHRTNRIRFGGRRIHFCLLAGVAAGLAASHWWGLPRLGGMGTLAAGSMLLLALGGLLELQEAPSRSHLLRLGTVFGLLAAAIVLYPLYTRTWSRLEQRLTTASTASGSVLSEALSEIRTACLVNVPPRIVESLPPGRAHHVEVLPLSRWRWWPARQLQAGRVHVVSMPAPRALRLSHARYQLVYQCVHGRDDTATYCSAEWLSELNRHLTAGGSLILDLPLSTLHEQGVLDRAATFGHVAPGPCWWSVVNGNEPRLLLRSGPAPAGKRTGDAVAWRALDELLDHGTPSVARILSIRQGNARHDQKSPSALNSLPDWLTERTGTAASVVRATTPP
ncbi:MAG TPA: hypothetical protein PLV57_16580 [Phycisphaerae bacterium]|nr:hypothetical protein [Phycisphaerae bacterium]HOM50431.1 hypothetical protein [Phycisphaerae bacterium]HPP28131.1 hypothetical protein [Phycisphaerae bacterium]